MGKALGRREDLEGSNIAKHVVVCTHRVVVHERLASEGFVVEESREVARRPFRVMALLDHVLGEVLFEIPFTVVDFLEIVDFIV